MSVVETTSPVSRSIAQAPVIGVVRTHSVDEARQQARALVASGLELVEITFTVPGAESLTAELLAQRGPDGPPWLGMGSVTTGLRAEAAVAAGADFIVSPNVSAEVAEVARRHGKYLIIGALTPTEIAAAHQLGANLVKVYPLPAVGGARYLEIVRGPLWDIEMLAAGGFAVDEIPAYRQAGARAFGMAAPLLLSETDERDGVARAVALARGES